jgi:hypothetical protein
MANKLILKKSSVVDRIPTALDLNYGELAINYTDEKLYFKNSTDSIKVFTSDDKSPSLFARTFMMMGA